ncbi:MAG: nucleoside hydrolase, partial [archaeon]|nr:nucleoside hydrolase [archaeon]
VVNSSCSFFFVMASATPSRRLFFDHDGNNDDLVSLTLLSCLPVDRVPEVLGVTITPADCFLEPAAVSTELILEANRALGHPRFMATRIGVGVIEGPNPFPNVWRRLSEPLSEIVRCELLRGGLLGEVETEEKLAPAAERLPAAEAVLLEAAAECRRDGHKLVLLFTGPLTNLAAAMANLADKALLEETVERLYWMGGSVDVKGNVRTQHLGGRCAPVDGSAEWNSFWDPPAADVVFRSAIPITVVSLDSTDVLPLTQAFLDRVRARPHGLWARLSVSIWQPSLKFTGMKIWDVFATLVMAYPELFPVCDVPLSVVTTGPAEGQTIRDDGGKIVQVVQAVDPEQVYSLLLEIFEASQPNQE